MMTNEEIRALAVKLEDAYSTDRYTGGWSGCIRMLAKRRYNNRAIEAIIRSKWTRWAGDAANKNYRCTSADLARFLDNGKNFRRGLAVEVDQLVRETFGGAA